MYNQSYGYPYRPLNHMNGSLTNYGEMQQFSVCPYGARQSYPSQFHPDTYGIQDSLLTDYGARPYVMNINEAAKQNTSYRTTIWSGDYLQATVMSLNPGEDIGLEMHADVDQFIRVEQGNGIIQMGNTRDQFTFQAPVYDDSAIFIPAHAWHNLTNTGNIPLKLYSIYAPPNHPFGTIHPTKAEAMAAEHGYGQHD